MKILSSFLDTPKIIKNVRKLKKSNFELKHEACNVNWIQGFEIEIDKFLTLSFYNENSLMKKKNQHFKKKLSCSFSLIINDSETLLVKVI